MYFSTPLQIEVTWVSVPNFSTPSNPLCFHSFTALHGMILNKKEKKLSLVDINKEIAK